MCSLPICSRSGSSRPRPNNKLEGLAGRRPVSLGARDRRRCRVEIVVTRTAEGRSTTRVRRDDGVVLELPSYVPLHRLPHDLAHFVVERALGLTWGFWGSIAAGAIFGGMDVVPRRRTARIKERSRKVMKDASSRDLLPDFAPLRMRASGQLPG